MGMRSSVLGSDLRVINKEKFIAKLVAKKAIDRNYYWDAVIIGDENTIDLEVSLDIDDWKIQGYWYEGLCEWLIEQKEMGLRGHIDLDYESQQGYRISFKDSGVVVSIGPELIFDDETEEYLENDAPWEDFKLTKKGIE